tara:strand:- start:154 stop:894 length:741 start_codon:yes stop_codon:yes gene_type:complete
MTNEPRTIGWFSCGAASAVATKLVNPDVIAYCETGSEHPDNKRFMADCEKWFGKKITILQSPDFTDTWAVWEKRRYISGIEGAPCTRALKIEPRLTFQRPDDVHIFGYTEDWRDMARAQALQENWPDLTVEFPLIERGVTKAATIAMLHRAGIEPPLTYALGFPNANCLPCCKATSPAYWALVRQHFPERFERMVKLSRELGARLSRIDDVRIFIDEIPDDYPTVEPIAPECDMLCALAEQELGAA